MKMFTAALVASFSFSTMAADYLCVGQYHGISATIEFSTTTLLADVSYSGPLYSVSSVLKLNDLGGHFVYSADSSTDLTIQSDDAGKSFTAYLLDKNVAEYLFEIPCDEITL